MGPNPSVKEMGDAAKKAKVRLIEAPMGGSLLKQEAEEEAEKEERNGGD